MHKNKKNISILIISLSSGGAEKVVSLLLKKLKYDYNVTLVLFYDVIHFTIPKGVNVVILSKNEIDAPLYRKLFDSINFITKYYHFVKSAKINISVSFLAFPNLINGMIAMFKKDVKTIISERGFPTDNTTSKVSFYISKLFYPILYNKCDALFSNSVYINNDLKHNFGIKIPMEVIYNPIETPQNTIKPETSADDMPLNIITAGTLNKRKNHVMLLRALAGMKNNVKLTILGGGHLKNYLESRIIELDLEDKIKLCGVVNNVNEYFLKSNCFVLSSFTEGFPNALLEAMAVGLPCISSNCLSGPLELLNDNEQAIINDGDFYVAKFGLLVNNDDHLGLRKAFQYYRDHPQERVKFSRLGMQRSKEYHLDHIYSIFKNFIDN